MRHVRGDNIELAAFNAEDRKERDFQMELGYVIQSGPLKNFGFMARKSMYRNDFPSGAAFRDENLTRWWCSTPWRSGRPISPDRASSASAAALHAPGRRGRWWRPSHSVRRFPWSWSDNRPIRFWNSLSWAESTGEVIPFDVSGSFAMALRQPCGVVLGIAPLDAPVILATLVIAMPLACGNTVVLMASELSPAVHHLIGQVLQDAGLGDGVVNVVSNAPADAAAIVARSIANPAVRRVNFIGSPHVGRIVGELSALQLKPALLELGGKAPLLVLDDADLDAAVAAAALAPISTRARFACLPNA